ncbi:MAG: transporter substrate-binding domain-containing protein, partial [Desulfobacterales bacterium]
MDLSRTRNAPMATRAGNAGSTPAWMGILVSLWVILLAGGCDKVPTHRSLEDILKSGHITVITRNNAHCYYIYREQKMGFEYDMAEAFADFLGVKLNVETAHSWEEMIPSLTIEGGDFIAASMTITPERKRDVIFSDGYREIRQHLIVNRSNGDVNTVEDLSGRTVHVRRGTSYESRLSALQKEGIDLKIELHENTPTGELIGQVASNDIEITIADSDIAFLNRRYYPKIRVLGAISESEILGWATHRNAPDLRDQINLFLKVIHNNGQLEEIYKRYYADVETFDYLDLAAFHRRIKSRMPAYIRIIQRAADKHDFDWRLIAAQIYQESHFNPKAKSDKGAHGLMQLTLRMATSLDVKDIFDPEQNIEAGTRYLRKLYDHFDK